MCSCRINEGRCEEFDDCDLFSCSARHAVVSEARIYVHGACGRC